MAKKQEEKRDTQERSLRHVNAPVGTITEMAFREITRVFEKTGKFPTWESLLGKAKAIKPSTKWNKDHLSYFICHWKKMRKALGKQFMPTSK